MFHKFSPYFLHFFFQFSPNFPNVKNSNCFLHTSTDVWKHTGKGKTFYSDEFFLCKKYMDQLHGVCVNQRNGFGCVAHKRIYSQWLQRYMMPSVFFAATPERNATATRKEALWWNGFYSDSLKQTVDQLWEHCTARADPTSAVDANLERLSPPKTEPLPQRNGLLQQHVRTWGETNYTPASLQADINGLVQQARSKRFNKTSKASTISPTESAASRGAKSHSNQTLKSYICANSQQKSHLSRIKCQLTKYDKGLYNINK